MSPGNEKTWEAAARREPETWVHRWQHEGSCAASAPARGAGGVAAACAGSLRVLLTRAGSPGELAEVTLYVNLSLMLF